MTLAEDMSTHYFPKVEMCSTCDIEYKCFCLYDSFFYVCVRCARKFCKYHPPYNEKIARYFQIDYGPVIEWFRDNILHNENGPAVQFTTYKSGTWTDKYKKLWYLDGKKIENVFSQEEFLKSKEYREWKLKAFI